MREKVLFLEGDDSARSRMAAGWLEHLGMGSYCIRTAGPFPAAAPRLEVVEVMDEVGIPILGRPGIHTREYLRERFDRVYAICDQEGEPCPVFLGGAVCWSVPDPARVGVNGDPLAPYREVRDRVRELVRQHFGV